MEADETYFLESFKRQRHLTRTSRRRGGKASKRGLSEEQVPMLIVRDREKVTFDAVFSTPSSKENIRRVLADKLGQDTILYTDSSKALKAFAKEQGICGMVRIV